MKKIIAFDLDDTLAVTKSPISDRMAEILTRLLEKYQVCIISGGKFEQFVKQVINRLDVAPELLARMHLMPTCGTRYYRFDLGANDWRVVYAEDLSDAEKAQIRRVLEESAKEVSLWAEQPAGEIIEDRLSQITYSALGQEATAEAKYIWAREHEADKQILRQKIADRLPELEVRLGGTTSVDVTRKGIDKAYGMRKLMEYTGASKDEILFFGDKLDEGGNDYPVKAFGIDSIAVAGWEATAYALEGVLGVTE